MNTIIPWIKLRSLGKVVRCNLKNSVPPDIFSSRRVSTVWHTRSCSRETGSTVFQKKTTFLSLFLCCTNFYTVLKTTQTIPSSIHLVSHVMHLSFPIVTRLFFTIHCLLAAWVSLPIIIFHFLSLITLLSVVHVSIMSRGNEIFFPEKNDFFLKERNSSFSFNLLVPKLINNLR